MDGDLDFFINHYWEKEPDIPRIASGVPNRVDRLKCLGNAVVPQQFYPIFRAIAEAEENRKKYKTIIPKNLSERITVEYEPRDCDGKILWAQIGIIDNMLFWKENVTYQFLEPYENEKKLKKEYEKHRKNITEQTCQKYRILEEEKPMRRLYWSKHGFYADAEYVEHNG